VAELTDNRFQIQVFAAGEIIPGLQVLDAVQNGTVEAGHRALLLIRQGRRLYVRHGSPLRHEQPHEKRLVLPEGPDGRVPAHQVELHRLELNTPEDLKGVKMRIGGFAGLIMQKLGMIPQQIAGGDIYPALEKGTIDAAEWVGPYDDEKLGFVKVAKYYYYPGWWEPGSTPHFIFNLQKWDELLKLYLAVLKTVAQESGMLMTAKYDADNPVALKRLAAAGAVLRPWSPEIMDASWKAANELYAELSAKNEWFKRFYDHFTAFRTDQYLWWQVADYTMDSYMIRYRNLKA
jgi:TRAP-type mannitol/chloroaromatic compound transport system substrate-binding protein